MQSLVYIEMKDGKPLGSSLELITAAEQAGHVTAVMAGRNLETAASEVSGYGADVFLVDTDIRCQDEALGAIETAASEVPSGMILFGATQDGKDLAPRLAARIGTGCVTDATGYTVTDTTVIFTRPAYGGTIIEKLQFGENKTAVATVRGGSFGKPQVQNAGTVRKMTMDADAFATRAKVVETTVEITELVNLEGADVIVSGGRGCQNEKTFGLVKELAELLGGVTGASRPAIEAGWISRAHQVGQSGKNVAPKLYIACGISGAMQHLSGITGSDYIVAINKDGDAPIFDVADIGIVGKCEDILPLMIEEIRKKKA